MRQDSSRARRARLAPVFLLPLLLAAPQSQRREAELRLMSRDYKVAVGMLTKELAAAERDKNEPDRVLFLLANAQFLSGSVGDAERSYTKLISDYPSSSLRFLAQFGLARCQAKTRHFQAAAEVYEKQIARLLSAKRRERLSEVYLGLAGKALAKDPVDRKAAISFLDLAIGLELPRAKAHELGLRAAKLAFEAKDYRNAVKRFQALVIAGREAWTERLWLARSWRRVGAMAQARRLLEDLLREGIPAAEAPLAQFELAKTYRVPNASSELARGIDELARFLKKWPTDEKAPEAAWLEAQSQANLGRLEDALATLDFLIKTYGDRDVDQVPQAVAERGKFLGRLQRFDEAVAAWKQYLSRFPAHGRWMDAQRAIVDLEFAKAEAVRAEGKEKYDTAVPLYEAFLAKHPLDPRDPGIHLTLANMRSETEDFEAAKRLYERCAAKYPGTNQASEALYRIGYLLETKLFNYPAALAAYRKVTGKFRSLALARLRVLEQKSLTLSCERVFHTDEKPRMKLVSRNVPKLRVRVYKLDFSTFFRGTLGAGDVQSLAIEAISPDASFDSPVSGYMAHKETEREIELPFTGAGAYVVKVDDQELEATALCLVSDLAVITKTSKKELFLFAENTRLERAWSGAEILVTDGKKILAEGKTDARGSYRLRGEKVEKSGKLYVFATAKDGSAATTLDLSGLSLSKGLVAKTFLYTDRGFYRPGEKLSARAILRDVDQGLYHVPAEKSYDLDLLDGAGRQLGSHRLELTDVGTLASSFDIPAGAAPGNFALRLRRAKDGRVLGTTSVRVGRIKPPRVALAIDSERTVLVRGEKIRGKVKATYFFGGAVAGKRVEVTANIAGHQRVLRGTTNDAGEFEFSFDSASLRTGATVWVAASVSAEQAHTQRAYRIESTGFTLQAAVPSSIYLVGENAQAKITAKSHDGKPLERKLVAELFRLVTRRGAVQELPAGKVDVTTSARDGIGFAGFGLAKGGRYRLLVYGSDRFDNRIEARTEFFVSGEQDKVKLRLLSDVQYSQVGKKIGLRVVNRVGPRLCLITTEGDGVLSFETRVFPLGETRFDLELEEVHAPNFAYAIAMIDGRKFHTASKVFQVRRPLLVELTPSAKRVRPGGKLAIEIRARDSRGRPVQAEFSLAAVDKALLELYPDTSPDLYNVFYSQLRSTDVRTSSSSTFRYVGRTHHVNADIRADEVDRLRKALEEKAKQVWRENAGVADGAPATGGEVDKNLARARNRLNVMRRLLRDRAVDEHAQQELQQLEGFVERQEALRASGGRFAQTRQGQQPGQSHTATFGALPFENVAQLFGKQLGSLEGKLALDSQAAGFDVFSVGSGAGKGSIELPLLFNDQSPASQVRMASAMALSVWVASVTTGKDGVGRVEIQLPEKAGRWKLRARGISGNHLVGEATASIVTAKDLMVEVAVPNVVTEGDRPSGRVVVHNLADRDRRVELVAEADGKQIASSQPDVPGGGRHESRIAIDTTSAGHRKITAKVESGDASDAVGIDVEVLPWGVEDRVARSGRLSGTQRIELELPAGRAYRSRNMVIELGPDVPELLLSTAAFRGRSQLNLAISRFYCVTPTHANRAAAGLAALALYLHRSEGRPEDRGILARLRGQIEATIAEILSFEQGGQVKWIGHDRGRVDIRTTLLSWLFLERARAAGFSVDDAALERFRRHLPSYLRSRDLDLATLAFLVSAESGRADFARFNTLYRARRSMSLRALGHLCLAADAMKRSELVSEILPDLAARVRKAIAEPKEGKRPPVPGSQQLESVLWAVLALSKARGYEQLLRSAQKWVYRMRRPWGWANTMATALAVDFLAGRKTSSDELATRVDIEVNGRFKDSVDFRSDPSGRRIVVPAETLQVGKNHVTLATSGRGSVVWSALLSGITKELPEKNASKSLTRNYLQAEPTLDGQVLPEGFSTVDSKVKRWKNLATGVVTGGHVRVLLHYSPTASLSDKIGSFVVEEPLPAGTVVLPSEVSGNYDYLEMGDGFLRFYIHRRPGSFTANYTLRGFLQGKYRVLPTRLYSLDNPGHYLYGKPAEFLVADAAAEIADKRRTTPDELFARGKQLYSRLSRQQLESDAAARGAAKKVLNELYVGFREHLKDQPFRETARRLLTISLVENDHARTVELFEALKDRDENYVLGFEDMARVGASYYKSGEFEQALNVYQAIAETSFLKEVQIAGTLEKLGEVKESVALMEELFLAFPGLPSIRGAMYTLAQSLELKAREIAGKPIDQRVGTAIQLKRKARDLCYEFLLRHPDDADADEVSFSLASIAIEADQLDEAIDLLVRAQKAYATSTWLDDFLYLEGYAWFKKGEREKALARLDRVATEDFPIGKGRRGKSDSRWLATFLEGQIYHAAGRPTDALAEYKKVETRFPEAREAAVYFTRRRLALPEVTLIKPGTPSKLVVSYRNLESVDVTVYKVDLMRLYLMRKSLSDMGKVQLFGIAPVLGETIDLSTSAKYRDLEHTLELPMKDAGAYLVLAQSGELKSSGLLLRTDLTIEAQELPAEGRIRVNVKRDGMFLPNASVKVVGDRDGKIRSGKTDLRGIFVADDLQGRATVLVKADESYAFYRGKVAFGGPVANTKLPAKKQGQDRYKSKFNALELNDRSNLLLQQRSRGQLDRLYGNKQRGVEVRRAK